MGGLRKVERLWEPLSGPSFLQPLRKHTGSLPSSLQIRVITYHHKPQCFKFAGFRFPLKCLRGLSV